MEFGVLCAQVKDAYTNTNQYLEKEKVVKNSNLKIPTFQLSHLQTFCYYIFITSFLVLFIMCVLVMWPLYYTFCHVTYLLVMWSLYYAVM